MWHVNAVGGIKRTYCGYLTKLNFQSSNSTEPKIGLSDCFMVAEAVGKAHKELLRDIRTYCGYLGESKIGHSDFFIGSTYKLTGQKGVVFTALYINAFHTGD